MRVADAPPAGWYPDPLGRTRLRWWDGEDWTDHHRAPPLAHRYEDPGAIAAGALGEAVDDLPDGWRDPARNVSGMSRADTNAIIDQVRQVARAEVDRAAEVFGQRAESAARQIEPLVTQYTSRLLRLVRIAVVIGLVLVVGWILFQVFVQATFFEWLGDRIDNLSE